MKFRRILPLFALAVACWLGSRPAIAEDLDAHQLVGRVLESNKTSGFRIRAKLTVAAANPERHETLQLLIKGRTDASGSHTFYQVLWPADYKRNALLIERSLSDHVGGFLFDPQGKVQPLAPKSMALPVFHSDLAIEDLTEDFWHWPSQKIAGEEIVKGRPCKIVESRPPGSAPGGYSLVKTWIAPDLALALRIQKFNREGVLAKTFTMDRIVKQPNNRWVAANLTVEPSGGQSRTLIEASRSDRDIEIPAEEFTVAKIKALLSLP